MKTKQSYVGTASNRPSLSLSNPCFMFNNAVNRFDRQSLNSLRGFVSNFVQMRSSEMGVSNPDWLRTNTTWRYRPTISGSNFNKFELTKTIIWTCGKYDKRHYYVYIVADVPHSVNMLLWMIVDVFKWFEVEIKNTI